MEDIIMSPCYLRCVGALAMVLLLWQTPKCDAAPLKTMNELCRTTIENDDFDSAEILCKSALDAAERTGGSDLDLAVSAANLADVFVEQDKIDRAEVLYLRALTIYRQIDLENSIAAATVMEDLGDLYSDQEQYENAEPYFRRALEIRAHIQGNDALETIELRNEYERVLRQLGRKR